MDQSQLEAKKNLLVTVLIAHCNESNNSYSLEGIEEIDFQLDFGTHSLHSEHIGSFPSE